MKSKAGGETGRPSALRRGLRWVMGSAEQLRGPIMGDKEVGQDAKVPIHEDIRF